MKMEVLLKSKAEKELLLPPMIIIINQGIKKFKNKYKYAPTEIQVPKKHSDWFERNFTDLLRVCGEDDGNVKELSKYQNCIIVFNSTNYGYIMGNRRPGERDGVLISFDQ